MASFGQYDVHESHLVWCMYMYVHSCSLFTPTALEYLFL